MAPPHTCLDDNPHAIAKTGSINIQINFGAAGFCLLVMAFIYWKRTRNLPTRGHRTAKPDFGVGAIRRMQHLACKDCIYGIAPSRRDEVTVILHPGVCFAFAALGLCFSLPPIVVYFIAHGIHYNDVACQVQAQMLFGFPFWSLFMCYMLILMYTFNATRVRTRYGVVEKCVDFDTDKHVLVVSAYRGLFSDAVVRQFADYNLESKAYLGTGADQQVTAMDAWSTSVLPEKADWMIENSMRSREEWLSTVPIERKEAEKCWPVLSIKQTTYQSIPLESNSVDTILWTFSKHLHVLNQEGLKKKQKNKLVSTLLSEYARVLKPGGTLYSVDLVVSKKETESWLKEFGNFDGPEELPGLHFLTFIPSKVVKWTLPESARVSREGNYDGVEKDLRNQELELYLASEQDYASCHEKALPSIEQKTFYFEERCLGLFIMIVIYLGIIAVSLIFHNDLAYPKEVSWENNVSNQFVTMVQFLPLSAVYMLAELNTFCHSHSASGEVREAIPSRSEYWFFYLVKLRNIAIIYLIFNTIKWIPSLILDYMLNSKVNPHTLSVITTTVNIFIFMIVIKSLFRFYTWYKKKQEETEDSTPAENDLELGNFEARKSSQKSDEGTVRRPLLQ